ncbi:ribosomal RNA small subunit methyltransferase A [Mycoplasma sp. CAG:776]|nr:ribosomal RNA small subunit methyltransferase A [Mycoplasma sp. CAG:776]
MNIKAKKSLGQNFLQDENVLKKIANSIKTNEDDLIIEIGPGKGALTKYLQKKNSFLTCYEIDLRMKEILKKFENEKTQIIIQDFLKANIIEDHQKYNYKDIYVIANIPYYITTPIIKHILNQEKIKSMTLLVQKEVAERFTAKPKSKAYGSLTVYLNYYFNVTYLFDVSRSAFYPVPNVESAVVKFERKNEKSNLKNEEVFFKLINDSFKMKRKTLKNNLKGYEWDKIKNVLEENNLNENVRAEELSLEIFEEIANILS